MSTSAEKLIRMKEEIEDAKEDRARYQGTLQGLMTQLKENFGLSSLEAAKDFLKKKEKERDELNTKIEKAIEVLERDYEWEL